MPVVEAGSRVLLKTPKGERVLRTLKDVYVDPAAEMAWFVPVVADIAALGLGPGTAEFPTPDGLLQAQVVLEGQGSGLGLRAIGPNGKPLLQRRGDVRSQIKVPLRGALLPDGPLSTRPAPLTGDGARRPDIDGTTLDASGGGLAAHMNGELLDAVVRDGSPGGTRALRAGSRLYVEMDLPDGRGTAAAVAIVVVQRGALLRLQFHDIAPADRERLVRMVFARHRDELKERRRAMDEALRSAE